MAETAQILGRIATGAFETTGRSESWAEQRVASVSVVGKAGAFDNVKPGDCMADYSGWFDGRFDASYFIRTVDVVTDGPTSEMKISFVKCPNGKTEPYNITWDVGMEEVQTPLMNLPMILENANLKVLMMWEDTPKGMRIDKENKKGASREIVFQYRIPYNGGSSTTGWGWGTITRKDNPWEWAYCYAAICGITTYNRYLPVITKNSTYLEMPGATYSPNHIVTGGTISEFTGPDSIGHFDEPELKVAGYTTRNGIWFKNCDKFTINADGTATRTESWVFTNDPNHRWIYTDALDS